MQHFSFKMFHITFKMVTCRFKMANLSFQRVPGQDLAENGPFAFKPQKEFIKKNTASILENLAARAFKKESCMASRDREPWAGGM